MDRWSSRRGKSQRRERKKRNQRREKAREKKKSRDAVFFLCFVAEEGRKVGSLKRQVRSHLVGWEIKNWWKLQRGCGAKHILKSKLEHFWFGSWDEMPKKGTRLWREAHLEVKTVKEPHVRTTFGCSSFVLCGRRNGLCTLSKVSHGCGSCSNFKKRWQAWDIWGASAKVHDLSCGMRTTGDMIGGQGADFLRGVLHFGASDHQVC